MSTPGCVGLAGAASTSGNSDALVSMESAARARWVARSSACGPKGAPVRPSGRPAIGPTRRSVPPIRDVSGAHRWNGRHDGGVSARGVSGLVIKQVPLEGFRSTSRPPVAVRGSRWSRPRLLHRGESGALERGESGRAANRRQRRHLTVSVTPPHDVGGATTRRQRRCRTTSAAGKLSDVDHSAADPARLVLTAAPAEDGDHEEQSELAERAHPQPLRGVVAARALAGRPVPLVPQLRVEADDEEHGARVRLGA